MVSSVSRIAGFTTSPPAVIPTEAYGSSSTASTPPRTRSTATVPTLPSSSGSSTTRSTIAGQPFSVRFAWAKPAWVGHESSRSATESASRSSAVPGDVVSAPGLAPGSGPTENTKVVPTCASRSALPEMMSALKDSPGCA